MHAFLSDEEHLRAFQQLTASPTGSVRKWERMLGWKPGRLQRFLASLEKYELAEVESCHKYSVFRPLVTVAERSGVMRSVAVPSKLGSSRHSKKLASGDRRTTKAEQQQPGADLLIATMNETLKRFDSYVPVLRDNWGSQRAARRWLVTEKIPIPDAIHLLRSAAEAFDIDLAPGHEFPESIAYFSKIVIARWRASLRNRDQLGLFPKLEMEVVRVAEYVPEPEGPRATPETVSSTMLDLAAQLGVKR